MLDIRWNGAEHEKATRLKPPVDLLNHFSDLGLRHGQEEGEVRGNGVVRGGLGSEVAEIDLLKSGKRDLFSRDIDHALRYIDAVDSVACGGQGICGRLPCARANVKDLAPERQLR